ncbi:hypothetical protein V1477_002653 [Vespula maculifrons]|uniref:Uncharacterized protein n=1 Tax=Vespula maculifrons TaxID=7453 RepID=A0ABD2CY11_VESMC
MICELKICKRLPGYFLPFDTTILQKERIAYGIEACSNRYEQVSRENKADKSSDRCIIRSDSREYIDHVHEFLSFAFPINEGTRSRRVSESGVGIRVESLKDHVDEEHRKFASSERGFKTGWLPPSTSRVTS